MINIDNTKPISGSNRLISAIIFVFVLLIFILPQLTIQCNTLFEYLALLILLLRARNSSVLNTAAKLFVIVGGLYHGQVLLRYAYFMVFGWELTPWFIYIMLNVLMITIDITMLKVFISIGNTHEYSVCENKYEFSIKEGRNKIVLLIIITEILIGVIARESKMLFVIAIITILMIVIYIMKLRDDRIITKTTIIVLAICMYLINVDNIVTIVNIRQDEIPKMINSMPTMIIVIPAIIFQWIFNKEVVNRIFYDVVFKDRTEL